MRPSRRAVAWWSVAGVAVVGTAVTAVLMVGPPGASGDDDAEAAAGTTPRPTTAVVEQGTLTGTTTRAGTLSRLDGPTITGSAPGTITSLPEVGDVLAARSELFRVDDEPVTAFEGALPQWRAFGQGMAEGPDVRQVEENLRAWGYFTGTPDDRFDRRTATAVSAWQKDTGQERTGSIDQGALQFVTGSFTVRTLTVAVGDASGGDLYGTARDDGGVSVDLPGHGSVPGRVSDVGAAVADETTGTTTVPVTVSLDDPAAAGDLTEASVQVDFVSEVEEDVLHVPVLALGAAVGDGFVVEVLQPDGTTTAVPVEAGLFAGDRVEVSGALEAGDEVVVPA